MATIDRMSAREGQGDQKSALITQSWQPERNHALAEDAGSRIDAVQDHMRSLDKAADRMHVQGAFQWALQAPRWFEHGPPHSCREGADRRVEQTARSPTNLALT
jgi:hypothetical protein